MAETMSGVQPTSGIGPFVSTIRTRFAQREISSLPHGNLPFSIGRISGLHAASFSFMAGVMPQCSLWPVTLRSLTLRWPDAGLIATLGDPIVQRLLRWGGG